MVTGMCVNEWQLVVQTRETAIAAPRGTLGVTAFSPWQPPEIMLEITTEKVKPFLKSVIFQSCIFRSCIFSTPRDFES